jgi:RNA polymerase sigma-70 factor (ECF subfamily)
MQNAFLDHCRARAVRRCVVGTSRLIEEMIPAEEARELPRWRTVEDDVLHACIEQLPDHQKVILKLHLEGACYAEIAAQARLGINTVGTRLLRARKRVRTLLLAALPEQGALRVG